jgi:chromate reductase
MFKDKTQRIFVPTYLEMKKILAIGGSSSKTSINKTFAAHIASQLANVKVTTLNWDDAVLPLFSVDLEKIAGIPEAALQFKKQLEDTDAIVLSLAEHNGMITAAFKNLWDWTSRIDQKIWMNKPMFLAATSPGGRGGQSAFEIIKNLMPHYGGNVVASIRLPRFYQNFQEGKLVEAERQQELAEQIAIFTHYI